MNSSLRAAGVAALLLATCAPPAAAQAVAPPTLAGTDLNSFSGAATVSAARCSESSGYAAFSATGTAANGAYTGPYREDAAARLGGGGLSEDLESRTVYAAAHSFAIQSPEGNVFGTHRAVFAAEAAFCAKPFGEAGLYLSYFPDTRYAARIETSDGVYVDRGEGYVQVDIVESLDGQLTGNTQTFFDSSAKEVTQLLRRRDCRNGGFVTLAYPNKARCRDAADANRDR